MPWLDRLLGKNKYCPIKFATFNNAAYYSFQRVMERVSEKGTKTRGDFLDNFLEAKEHYPDVVGDNEVVSYLMMNVSQDLDSKHWHALEMPKERLQLTTTLGSCGSRHDCHCAKGHRLLYPDQPTSP
jgi:hypothetical protein